MNKVFVLAAVVAIAVSAGCSSHRGHTAISIPTPGPNESLCPNENNCAPDPDGYLTQIRAAGITVFNETTAVNIGRATCGDIASGISSASLAASLREHNTSLTVRQANSIVDAALIYLCPQNGTFGMLLPGQMTN